MRRTAEGNLATWLASSNRKPLVLRGARQVGKSTLVRQAAAALDLDLWEVNLERHASLAGAFESFDVSRIVMELGLLLRRKVGEGRGLLFLDEIQAVPQALAALRYFHEERPELAVIAAGSLLEFALRRPAAAMPVGRIEFFHVGPVGFLEFVEATAGAPMADFVRSWRFGEPWLASAHDALQSCLRSFLICGAMPEAAALLADSQDLAGAQAVHRSILETYREDFAKYAGATEIEKVRRLYDVLPANIGQKMRWSRVNAAWKSVDLRRAFDLLEQAGVVSAVRHADGTGVPLGATANNQVFKVLFLDGGLAQTSMGLPPMKLEDFLSYRFVNEGPIAEQFIGQHLRQLHLGQKPELHYFLREGKSGNAEVDFLLQVDNHVVPIEVKAGAAGSMRSLHQFVALRNTKLAVRFDMNPPSVQEISTTVTTGTGPQPIRFRLLSLPLFLVERVHEIARGLL